MKPKIQTLPSLLVAALAALTTQAQAEEVLVAVATNFVGPLATIGKSFTAATGHTLKVSSGATGKFFVQIATGTYAHLAIANPKLAPYGRAGLEVLKARGLADAIVPKLVTGESIAQAHQFVATGNAELGFVALSQVAPQGKPVIGSYWLVPSALYGEIRQDAVLLKTGEKNPAAAALLVYLKSPAAKAVIRSYGYGP